MNRDLKLLAGAAGVSALGDFLAVLPFVVHVQAKTGSAFAVSAVFFALWGPLVLAAGVAGSIVDRFENRALLVGVSFAQAACVAGIALTVDQTYVALPLLAFVGFGAAVGQPAEFALVPAAAGEGELARANGLMETLRALGFTAGPLLGGLLGAAGLLQLALVIDALSFAAVGSPRSRCGRAGGRRGREDASACARRLRLPRPRPRARDHARRRRSPR